MAQRTLKTNGARMLVLFVIVAVCLTLLGAPAWVGMLGTVLVEAAALR